MGYRGITPKNNNEVSMNFKVRSICNKYTEMSVDAIETSTLDKSEAQEIAFKMIRAAGELLHNVDCTHESIACDELLECIEE